MGRDAMTPALVDLPDDDPRALVSDREREHAAAIINQAFREGRLDDDGHEVRAGQAQSARTRHDLDIALNGIPASTATDAVIPAPATPDLADLVADLDDRDDGRGALALALIALIVFVFFGYEVVRFVADAPPGRSDTPSPAKVVREGMADLNQVVRAERTHLARTGRYTRNWTTLGVHNPVIADWEDYDGFSIDLTDDHRGAILRWRDPRWIAHATLRVILDDQGHADQRCLPFYGERCPQMKVAALVGVVKGAR